eukprot:CAMPEP_0184860596 /NCGR_PEP_ID=MMETSP0580-20130426/5459_1 /TAXON_ID=1118495 /ORGANISM="Dactyliosolen fragilissimus" /LENGTH=854 /DNA_ID=CAMNT_0027357761 /DNA_START=69 /DNA_END=2633 /DNA_ORIENTATION=-
MTMPQQQQQQEQPTQEQDEAKAELLATIQNDHVKMKEWYNNHPSASSVRRIHGSTYPTFWRDVIDWDGWKDARKRYLAFLDGVVVVVGDTAAETGEVGGASAADEEKKKGEQNVDAVAVDASTTATSDDHPPPAIKRKRKSRWATASSTTSTSTSTIANTTNTTTGTSCVAPPTRRKSRWASDPSVTTTTSTTIMNSIASSSVFPNTMTNPPTSSSTTVLDLLPGLPNNLDGTKQSELMDLQAKLREANERLENLELKAARMDALPRGHPDRSPSPPPIYGADGVRKNTRAVRWREKYTTQRQDTLEKILSLTNANNNDVAPSLFKRKRFKKIRIPVDEHPTYNFIGLIIGPRGKTQKDMENKTGCKIAIRGRGSIKEGARGRRDGRAIDGEDEPLHVVVTGDDQANVDAAADMVEQMMVVIDDDKNVHKQQQLRELALLNGTLKDDEYCTICAEKGHRPFECPKRFSLNNKSALTVKCALCGDSSHPTRDCILNKNGDGLAAGGGDAAAEKAKQLDSDYMDFMAELDGGKKDAGAGAGAGAATSSSAIATTNGSTSSIICPIIGTSAATTSTPVDADSFVLTTISKRIIKPGEVALSQDVSAAPPTIPGTEEATIAAPTMQEGSVVPTTATTESGPVASTIVPTLDTDPKTDSVVETVQAVAPASTVPLPDVTPVLAVNSTNLPTTQPNTTQLLTTAPLPTGTQIAPTQASTALPAPPPPPPIMSFQNASLPPPPPGIPPPLPAQSYPQVSAVPQQPYGTMGIAQQQVQTLPQTAYYTVPQVPSYNQYAYNTTTNLPQQSQLQTQQHQQQQQTQHINSGTQNSSATWDYKSFYGAESTNGNEEAAGGFNWWES